MSQGAAQPPADAGIITRDIAEEDDDRAEALEQGEEDRGDDDVNQAAADDEVKTNCARNEA